MSAPDARTSDRFAAIVLAAGLSRRMGRHKPLLPIGDRAMIAHVVDGIIGAGITNIYVVTGHLACDVRGALANRPVHFIANENFVVGGMLSSVQLGVRAAHASCDAFFISLGDQPFIDPETFRQMTVAFIRSRAPILLPTHNGKHGHPVLIASDLAPQILALRSDETLNDFAKRQANETLEIDVDDPAVVEDIDTPEDYARALARKGELCSSPTPTAE
jgi:molybdenum cofactor cytidylyltransferase